MSDFADRDVFHELALQIADKIPNLPEPALMNVRIETSGLLMAGFANDGDHARNLWIAYKLFLQHPPATWKFDAAFVAALRNVRNALEPAEHNAEIIADLDEDIVYFQSLLQPAPPPQPLTTISNYDQQSLSNQTPCPIDEYVQAMEETLSDSLHVHVDPLPAWHQTAARLTIHDLQFNQAFTLGPGGLNHEFQRVPSNIYSPWVSADNFVTRELGDPVVQVPGPYTHWGCKLLPGSCHLTCTKGFSLPLQAGCISGFELLRIAFDELRTYCTAARGLQRNAATLPNVVRGGHWLWLAGRLQELNATMIAISADKAGVTTCQTQAPWFQNNLGVNVGVGGVLINRKAPLVARHPRILYANGSDLPYNHIPAAIVGAKTDAAKATELLTLLSTGVFASFDATERGNDAAFLVHIFGVEANKNNLAFLTGAMALELIEAGITDFNTVFYQFDTGNALGLGGSGGMFGMASFKADTGEGRVSATLGALKAILEAPSTSTSNACMARVESAMRETRSDHQNMIIPMKEMLMIVRWCMRFVPTHGTSNAVTANIRNEIRRLLGRAYPHA